MELRIGLGHDTHRLGSARPLRIGGVHVPYPLGLIGHSDADVLLHAVTDALLGALGLGDIGEWFPDTDPSYENADSATLLEQVVSQGLQAGDRIMNLDCIIFAQQPKLSPYKKEITANLARLLQVEPNRVNVKAKTGEHVGPIGRQEAIAAEVVVLIQRAHS